MTRDPRHQPLMMADIRVRRTPSGGDVAAITVGLAWVVMLVEIARHRIFVSHDTMISYAHVWYISRRIWTEHRVPWRMPVLGYGHAYAFPYGIVPWFTAGLVRPLFGDWTVTAWLVIGIAGAIGATFWAFPELRRDWWAAAVFVNPAVVAGALIGQIPFLWATALLLVAIGLWRRGRHGWATAFAAAAQLTHVAVVGPITALVVIIAWRALPADRQRLIRCYAISLLGALPAAAVVFTSPVFTDSSTLVKLENFVGTIAPRSLLVLVPLALVWLRSRWRRPWVGPVAVAALVGALWFMWGPIGLPWAWRALSRRPDVAMDQFLSGAEFRPGGTYRVLRVADGKIGMYQVIRRGGRLDAEFFPESIIRRSWPDTRSYESFLEKRHVDAVMVWKGYVRKYKVNEQQLLERISQSPGGCDGNVCVRVVETEPKYVVYRFERLPLRAPNT